MINSEEHIAFITNYLTKGVRKYNAVSGESMSRGNCIADLGDIVLPFIHECRLSEIKSYIDMCSVQSVEFDDSINLASYKFTRLYEYSDFLFGHILLEKWGKKRDPLFSTYQGYSSLNIDYIFDSDFPLLYPLDKSSRIASFISKISRVGQGYEDLSMFLELAVCIEEINSKKNYSKQLVREYYLRDSMKGLLPIYRSRMFENIFGRLIRPSSVGRFQLHKETTNTLYGFLKLYKVKNCPYALKMIRYLLDNYIAHAKSVNSLFTVVIKNDFDLDLTIFHLLDFLIEYTAVTKDRSYLEGFLELENDILIRSRKKTGLIPFSLINNTGFKRINIDIDSSWLDSSVDIACSLIKLGVYENKESILNLGMELRESVYTEHANRYGYVNVVNAVNSTVIDPISAVKTLALVYKLKIAMDCFESEQGLDEYYIDMLSDR